MPICLTFSCFEILQGGAATPNHRQAETRKLCSKGCKQVSKQLQRSAMDFTLRATVCVLPAALRKIVRPGLFVAWFVLPRSCNTRRYSCSFLKNTRAIVARRGLMLSGNGRASCRTATATFSRSSTTSRASSRISYSSRKYTSIGGGESLA